MPKRIQRRRAKGWRMPEGAVYVGRGSPWGNPFVVGQDGTREDCVCFYRFLLAGCLCMTCKAEIEAQRKARAYVIDHIHELRGKDLVCWCRNDGKPCHADVLLELANKE